MVGQICSYLLIQVSNQQRRPKKKNPGKKQVGAFYPGFCLFVIGVGLVLERDVLQDFVAQLVALGGEIALVVLVR